MAVFLQLIRHGWMKSRGLFLLVLILMVVTGCNVRQQAGRTGRVVLSADTGSLRALHARPGDSALLEPFHTEPAFTVTATLTKDQQRLIIPLALTDGIARGSHESVLIGKWDVAVEVRDADGDTPYAGKSSVVVRPNETTAATVSLEPKAGTLVLTVDVAGLDLEGPTQRARVTLSPGGYTSFERIPNTTLLQVSKDLAPGTYDAKVTLYGDSYLAGDRLYESEWFPVTIWPGKTHALSWSPQTGRVDIDTRIITIPAAPASLAATPTENGILLTWDPVFQSSIDRYLVYSRTDIFDPFKILGEVPASETSFTHEVTAPWPNTRMRYVVTALGTSGYESPRSAEVSVVLPPLVHQ